MAEQSPTKKLSDAEILAIVESQVKQSIGHYDSRLARERQDVTNYYNGVLPKRQSSGNASYVSTDVYDAVEAMKAQLLETFASGDEIVKFDPQGPEDVRQADIATKYTSYVVFRQNNGYSVFNNVIHDGLTARAGVCKVDWEEKFDIIEEEFEGLDQDSVTGLASLEDVEELEAELDPLTGLYKGEVKRKIDKSQVTIEPVPPEEFLISPRARSIEEAAYVGQRTVKTFSELMAMGFDEKKLARVTQSKDSFELESDPDVLTRFQEIDSGYSAGIEGFQKATNAVILYDSYIEIDLNDSGKAKLHRVIHVGNVVLEVEEVDRKPFVGYVPLPIPHSFFGNNFAQRVMPTQNARTVLMRGILDHTAVTNNPRYQVVKGGLVNPRELLDNRLGGLVNVTRPDAITPIIQASLNPFVFQTLQLLQANREETTGVSSLSQGLNKDAVSKQNSADMIDSLVSLSQQRQKILARNFANNFLVPLFLEVYRLVIENESEEKIIEVAGDYLPVRPSDWIERKDVAVAMALGYGERDKRAQGLVNIFSLIGQDPDLRRFVQPNNAYNIINDVLMDKGYKNVNDYITPPDRIPQPQPDPMYEAELGLKQAQAMSTVKIADAQANKSAATAEAESIRVQLEAMQQKYDEMFKMLEFQRKDAETANRIEVAQRELAMAEQATAEAVDTKASAIISPNS
jgi:hypothetical protein